MSKDNQYAEITAIVDQYFKGAYYGDAKQLQAAFHPEARICGNFDGNYVDLSLTQFIERVIQAQSHKTDDYNKTIVNIDVNGDIAIVKAHVVVGERHFTDYLSLLKINDKWCIRHKGFSNHPAA